MPFQPKFSLPAIFAEVEHGPFPNKKSRRCALTGVAIAYGEPAYMVKFTGFNDDERYYVSEDAARSNAAFMQCVDDLEKRMYPPGLMFYSARERAELVDPEWVAREKEIERRDVMRWIAETTDDELRAMRAHHYGVTIEDIPDELAKPEPAPRPHLSDEALWEKVRAEIEAMKSGMDRRRGERAWRFFGAVVLCSLHRRLAACFADLPPELQVLLACSDNLVFARLAAGNGLLPDWEAVSALIAKSRLSLDDMLRLADWGKANPTALALLWKTHAMFGILSFDNASSMGFTEMMGKGHSAYLLFLFTARPDLAPMLTAFVPEDPFRQGEALRREFHGFVPEDVYQYPYLYRARVFAALLAGDAPEARRLVSLMREHVNYYFHGDPSGFINATEKMAEQFIRKHIK